MSSTDLKVDDILIRVKGKLNNDQIKLWLPPFYIEEIGPNDEDMERLSRNYGDALGIPQDKCRMALNELQYSSLEGLRARNRFRETGIATLKVRIPSQNGGTKLVTHEISLTALGEELRTLVAGNVNVPLERIKLIANGKVLKDNFGIGEQGVKNGMQLMAVVLHGNPNEIEEVGAQLHEVENVRADTQLLANTDSRLYMQLEDQSGNAINLPPHERSALMVAMALHEKGRVALKREDYALALVMFLDADKEFRQCNSQILKSVDNYAVLNLDIAWCYLNLRSVSHIPEAEERLRRCEENFHRSYGQNLERLIALKGTPGNEAALFMRLHLLQAIVLYHQNRRMEAKMLLERAESELKSLKVDETSILALVELGYSTAEARLGLRATHGNVNAAAEYINENREKRQGSRKKAAEEWTNNKKRQLLGKCADGQWVNEQFLTTLESMGFNKEAAKQALQQSNNNISNAIQAIQDNPELLNLNSTQTDQIFGMLSQITDAGFDARMAQAALKKHKGNLHKALEELLANDGIVEGVSLSDDDGASTSTGTGSSAKKPKMTKEERAKQKENLKKEEEAFERLSEGISMVDDDHLDLTLEQEEVFLIQYKSLLSE